MTKDKTSMKKFIAKSGLMFFISFIWYYFAFYTFHQNASLRPGLKILSCSTILIFMICVKFYCSRLMRTITAIICAIMPFCIYTCIFMRRALIIRSYYLMGVLIIELFLAMIVFMRKKHKSNYNSAIEKRVNRCVASQIMFSFMIGVLIIITAISDIVRFEDYRRICITSQGINNEITGSNDETRLLSQYTYSAYKDELIKFKSETWDSLYKTEKVKLLQLLINVEANSVGLDHRIKLNTDNLERTSISSGTVGKYVYSPSEEIIIDNQFIDEEESYYIIEVVCHEVYHAFQMKLVELYERAPENLQRLMVFENVQSYYIDLRNYTSKSKEYEEYYNMALEKDARKYAEKRAGYYYSLLYRIDISVNSGINNCIPQRRMTTFR